jgi:hypothetical protein
MVIKEEKEFTAPRTKGAEDKKPQRSLRKQKKKLKDKSLFPPFAFSPDKRRRGLSAALREN